MRRDEIAWTQLHAAIAVVNAYVADTLATEDWKEAKDCIQALTAFLRSDKYGPQAGAELSVDLIDMPRRLDDHVAIDVRYREQTLKPEIEKLAEKAAARAWRKSS